MLSKTDPVERDPEMIRNLNEALYTFHEANGGGLNADEAITIYKIVKLVLDGKFTEEMRL